MQHETRRQIYLYRRAARSVGRREGPRRGTALGHQTDVAHEQEWRSLAGDVQDFRETVAGLPLSGNATDPRVAVTSGDRGLPFDGDSGAHSGRRGLDSLKDELGRRLGLGHE